MQKHTKIYLGYAFENHGIDPHEAFCEITGKVGGTDVCHIVARGMGGNPDGTKNVINNLMCMSRNLHHETEGAYFDILNEIHESWMKTGRPFIEVDPERLLNSELKPILIKLKLC